MNGDYGMSFFGHAVASASYLVDHPTFGWVGFGGNISQSDGIITLQPKDSARNRIFIAPAGLWLTLDAGKFTAVAFDPKTDQVTVTLAPADAHTPKAYLNVKTTTATGKAYTANAQTERGAYVIQLGANETTIELTPKAN